MPPMTAAYLLPQGGFWKLADFGKGLEHIN